MENYRKSIRFDWRAFRRLPSPAAALCLAILCAAHSGKSFGVEVVNDVTGLNPIDVTGVVAVSSQEDIRQALQLARKHNLPVSMAGARHSQGGHIAANGGLVLDMSGFDRVLEVDAKSGIVHVQAGASWEDVQAAVNPKGLAVAVMQSSNIFTVGGSIAVNAHGRDPRYGPMLDTVVAVKAMLASGEVVWVDREAHPDLFEALFGSYGLIGVILEAKVRVVPNSRLRKRVERLSYDEYVTYLQDSVIENSAVELHFARLSFAPGDDFLDKGYAVDYVRVADPPKSPPELQPEQSQARNRWFFDLSRKFNWGKVLRWELQQRVIDSENDAPLTTRNKAMRPPVRFLSRDEDGDADVLQEYFVPLHRFEAFIDGMRRILVDNQVNLLSVTLRYMPAFNETALPYSRNDSIAVVLYLNVEADEISLDHARRWTRALIDLALESDGNYYLPYLGFAAPEQFQRAYPGRDQLLEAKRQFDPDGLFENRFARDYLLSNPAGE